MTRLPFTRHGGSPGASVGAAHCTSAATASERDAGAKRVDDRGQGTVLHRVVREGRRLERLRKRARVRASDDLTVAARAWV